MKDSVLITSLLQGNEKCLRAFYVQYSPRLYNFIITKVSNPKDAEEILQDTLIDCLDALRDFTGNSSLYTYLCAIAKYKTVDYYRKKKVKRIVFSKFPAVERILSIAATPQDLLDERITQEKVQEVLTKLRPNYSKALKLKYLHGLSVKQIALKMQISFKAAESILFRARKEFAVVYRRTRLTSSRRFPT
jgi:RNA polymerase sigma-70 factor (ECF subfamily)